MGGIRSTPDLKKHTINKVSVGFSYAVSHMCGWRDYMEDSHIAVSPLPDKKSSIFGVFDGHNGAEVSVFVKKHFVKSLKTNANFKKGIYQPALKETFLKMDELLKKPKGKRQIQDIQNQLKIQENGPKLIEKSRAGCTANVWLITPEYVYVANAGDSRGIACINGQAVEMSKDHKPDDEIEKARIQKAGGRVSSGRVNRNLNLSRALGDLQYKQNAELPPEQQIITANPDISKIKNQNIQFILIGCDGIWEVKSSEQMVKWMKPRIDSNKVPGDILQELFDELVLKQGESSNYGMDNMTAILIRFDNNKK